MQNMDYYYDFSGQKFGYPLSLCLNGFDRQAFSCQSSLELSYVLKGEYEAITEHFTCPVKEHELMMIAPGDIHMIRQVPGGEHVILTIHIDFTRFSAPMAGNAEGAFTSLLCTRGQNFQLLAKLRKKIGELVAMLLKGENNLFQMNAFMTELVSIASNHKQYPIEHLPLQSVYRENYMRAILYINNHFQESLHLKDVADALSFSNSYTSRLFKKYTGITFVRYLTYVRIRASLESLLEGRDSIEQISSECGLPNAKAYSTAFKELYGSTPTAYRKCFAASMKYNPENSSQPMAFDHKQRLLLEHLAAEADSTLYENAAITITHRDGHILCHINTDSKTKTTVAQANNEITIDIWKQ